MEPMVPNRQQLARYSVTRPGWEAVRQSFYDTQAYPAAGTGQLTYFQLPVGQGGKTYSDTNMSTAGMLAADQEYLVESIEVNFMPTVPAVAANNPAAYGAGAVAAQVNDSYLFYRTGNLQFNIVSKPYLIEAPLGRFPPKTHFNVSAAFSDSSTAGAGQNSRVAFPFMQGRPYLMNGPRLYLRSTQNFSITLNWPEGAQAITNPARVQVIMDGIWYRKSQ